MVKKKHADSDPVLAYARVVIAGEIIAGKPVRLACERHIKDLATAKEKGLEWRLDMALRAINFFAECLVLDNGKPFVLEPFQQFIVGSLFGWFSADGYRRFRTAYIEQGKGNGKTPSAAAVGLYGLIADKEPAAEIYSAAVTRDQAKIAFADAKKMVEASPYLSEVVDVGVGNLALTSTNSFFRPVSSEHKGLDGKRVHMALIDELHEHPTDLVVNKMRAGTKARRQALLYEITNSGFDRQSVCWNHHEYSLKVLQGLLINESWFAYVCSLDPCKKCEEEGKTQPNEECSDCDDWKEERHWLKANPGLGTILPYKYLREQVAEAIGMPSKENIVRRLNFCEWTQQANRWLSITQWDACDLAALDLRDFAGRECWAGLDLSSTTDLSALVLVFPPTLEQDWYSVIPFFWVPKVNAEIRAKRDKVDYPLWIKQKVLFATEGTTIDYDAIRACIAGPSVLKATVNPDNVAAIEKMLTEWGLPAEGLGAFVEMKEIAVDRWNSSQLQTQLMGDGFTVVQFGQGFASMTSPSKELEKLLASQGLNHGGHPVLRWQASNVASEEDAAGNVKPSKAKSTERIDGIVAMVMGLARAMLREETGDFSGRVMSLEEL
jgi:phage terminase large subunit-like protein